jgi:hypothetical protein
VPPRKKQLQHVHYERHHDWTGIEDRVRASEALTASKALEAEKEEL